MCGDHRHSCQFKWKWHAGTACQEDPNHTSRHIHHALKVLQSDYSRLRVYFREDELVMLINASQSLSGAIAEMGHRLEVEVGRNEAFI